MELSNRETRRLIALVRSAQPAIQAMLPVIQKMAAEAVKLANEIDMSEAADSWPVYNDGDYIMCGSDGCGCDMEESVILTPFESLDPARIPPYTPGELFEAVKNHILQQKARDEEEED